MKPVVQVLVGPIASGKSSYARNAARSGAIVINDDAIVTAVHGGDYVLYDKRLKPLYKSIENSTLAAALALGRTVIVDRGTNGTVKSRQRWVALARSMDADCWAIVFPRQLPEVHARRRCDDDPRDHSYLYWSSVAADHERKYEAPALAEDFYSIRPVTFDLVDNGGWLSPSLTGDSIAKT